MIQSSQQTNIGTIMQTPQQPTCDFYNYQVCEIHSTTDSALDGLRVVVKGISQDFGNNQAVLIIQRLDGCLFYNGFDCIVLTSSCLTPILK